MKFWVTIEVDAPDEAEAEATFDVKETGGRVVDVQPRPPQGSTVVGDYSY